MMIMWSLGVYYVAFESCRMDFMKSGKGEQEKIFNVKTTKIFELVFSCSTYVKPISHNVIVRCY